MFDEIGETLSETTNRLMGLKGRTTHTTTAKRRPILFLNDIRDLAHKKWMAAGRPPGDCTRFWLEAEQEIQKVR